MKKRNIVFGALFLLGGYWLIKNFLNKKIEAEKPVIDTGFECPLNELSEKEQKEFEAERDRFIKNDPIFGAFRYAEYKERTTPYWNPNIDCTPEEIEDFKRRLNDTSKWDKKAFELTPLQQKLIAEAIQKSKSQKP